MLAELVHSVADFANQVSLFFAMAVDVYTFPAYFMTRNKESVALLFIYFQALLAYGLSSSRRAPDALHPYVSSVILAYGHCQKINGTFYTVLSLFDKLIPSIFMKENHSGINYF